MEIRNRNNFHNILVFWFFITIIPQLLLITQSTRGGDIIKGILYIVFLSFIIIKFLEQETYINLKNLIFGVLFFTSILISSYIIVSDTNVSSIFNIIIMFFNYTIFMCLFYQQKLTIQGLLKIATFYQIFIIYACIINFINYGDLFIEIFNSAHAHEYMFKSFFTNRNTFALFLFVGSFFTIIKIKLKENTLINKIILLIIIINLFLTLSRTSILGFFILFVVYNIVKDKKYIIKNIITILALILLLYLILYFSGGDKFLIDIVIRPSKGTTGRIDIWRKVLDVYIHDNIFWGQGIDIMNRYIIHNSYLSILIMGGIPVAILYIRLYINTFKTIIKTIQKDQEIGSIFLIGFLAFLIISLFENIIPFGRSAKDSIFTMVFFLIPHFYLNSINNLNKMDMKY